MLNKQDFENILKDVSYNDWHFHVGVHQRYHMKPSVLYLQIQCEGIDNYTQKLYRWKGRKWLLSRHMTRSEVVQTALMACIAAMEHEVRETFKYRGLDIYNGHWDVDVLHEIRSNRGWSDYRPLKLEEAMREGNGLDPEQRNYIK